MKTDKQISKYQKEESKTNKIIYRIVQNYFKSWMKNKKPKTKNENKNGIVKVQPNLMNVNLTKTTKKSK